jgi:hypothetical protein
VFSCVHDMTSFLLSFHANNTPTRVHLLLTKPLHQEFFGMFLFSQKTMCNPMFSKGFLGNQSLVQNRNQIGVCSNKQVMKIQVIS